MTHSEKRIGPAGNGTDSENTGRRLSHNGSATLDVVLRLRLDLLDVSIDNNDDNVHLAHDEDVLARCRRCRHLLTAERSVSRGTGPVCAKAERGESL